MVANPIEQIEWRRKDAEPFGPGLVLQGTFRILHNLASGGMSEVYLAAHERLPSQFAIKALHHDLTNDEAALSRFRREAEIMSTLRHPNIVQVLDFNVAPNGTPYLVMEYLEGHDLGEELKHGRRLEPREVVGIVEQIASALDAAHARGVVHRDLKPENVVLVPLGADKRLVKVIDFGISKIRRAKRITANATLLGTPQFMAPEQAQGRRDEVDHRTDQFALAAMTYLLLTGHTPFRDDDPASVLYRIVHQEPEPMASFVQWETSRVEAVLRKAMAKRRDGRFGSVLEFARALSDAVSATPSVVPGPRKLIRLLPGGRVSENIRTRKTVRLRNSLSGRLMRVAAVAAFTAAAGVFAWTHLLGQHREGASFLQSAMARIVQ